jgi:hypothetical protein
MKFREFSRVCFVDRTAPDLIIGFTRVERVFDDFNRRAKVLFTDAIQTGRAAESRTPVSIGRAADSLLVEWRDFLARFLAVLTQSTAPLFPMMADRLDGLARVLQLLSGLFADPKPLVTIGTIRRVKSVIDGLRSDSDRLSAAARIDGWFGFDPFRLQRLQAQVRLLFSDIIPKNCLIVGGIADAKNDLLHAADGVIAVADAMAGFDQHSREVTEALLAMDKTMGDLFADLGITRGPRQDMPDKPFETSGTAESCDRIRTRIAQIELTLADTSKLYRTKA